MNNNGYQPKSTKSISDTQLPTSGSNVVSSGIAQYGWICPICGKALAPWVSECNCQYYQSGITADPDQLSFDELFKSSSLLKNKEMSK